MNVNICYREILLLVKTVNYWSFCYIKYIYNICKDNFDYFCRTIKNSSKISNEKTKVYCGRMFVNVYHVNNDSATGHIGRSHTR